MGRLVGMVVQLVVSYRERWVVLTVLQVFRWGDGKVEGGYGGTVSLACEGTRGSLRWICLNKCDGMVTCCCKIGCTEVSGSILFSRAYIKVFYSPTSVPVWWAWILYLWARFLTVLTGLLIDARVDDDLRLRMNPATWCLFVLSVHLKDVLNE